MVRQVFFGEFYVRGSGKNKTFRSRRSGEIINKQPRIIMVEGHRNRISIPKGTKVIGLEKTNFHFSGRDKPPQLITGNRLKKFQVRVRQNKPTAKKSRRSHSRRL